MLFIISKQMFQVSPISSHTGTQPSMLLVNNLVDYNAAYYRPDNAAVRRRFRSATSS